MMKRWFLLIFMVIILAAALSLYFFYFSAPKESINPPREVSAIVKLPDPELKGQMSVEEAIQQRRSVRLYSNKSLTLKDVSQLLWAAQGITDSELNLRATPSAGRTYPLEVYLVVGPSGVQELGEGVYYYNPIQHQLEKVLNGDKRSDLSKAANGQAWVRNAPVNIVITGDYQRTINKYGDNNNSIRFVHLEAGHAGENIYLMATARGLVTVSLGSFDDQAVQTLLHLPAGQNTLYIFPVGYPQS